jgi:hypothetical protein
LLDNNIEKEREDVLKMALKEEYNDLIYKHVKRVKKAMYGIDMHATKQIMDSGRNILSKEEELVVSDVEGGLPNYLLVKIPHWHIDNDMWMN